jgi:hypothetical protein
MLDKDVVVGAVEGGGFVTACRPVADDTFHAARWQPFSGYQGHREPPVRIWKLSHRNTFSVLFVVVAGDSLLIAKLGEASK